MCLYSHLLTMNSPCSIDYFFTSVIFIHVLWSCQKTSADQELQKIHTFFTIACILTVKSCICLSCIYLSLIIYTNCDSHHTISVISDPNIKYIRCVKTAIMSRLHVVVRQQPLSMLNLTLKYLGRDNIKLKREMCDAHYKISSHVCLLAMKSPCCINYFLFFYNYESRYGQR